MEQNYLLNQYFKQGTRGYKIIQSFYHKYIDVFVKTDYPDVQDFLNQIFINLSGIDRARIRKSEEDYMISAIHIQCRAILDKSIRRKKRTATFSSSPDNSNQSDSQNNNLKNSRSLSPDVYFDGQEIMVHLAHFRMSLRESDKKILNGLIDGTPRQVIAEELQMNLNTLDTNIRRLRLRLVDYFKQLDYSQQFFEQFLSGSL